MHIQYQAVECVSFLGDTAWFALVRQCFYESYASVTYTLHVILTFKLFTDDSVCRAEQGYKHMG